MWEVIVYPSAPLCACTLTIKSSDSVEPPRDGFPVSVFPINQLPLSPICGVTPSAPAAPGLPSAPSLPGSPLSPFAPESPFGPFILTAAGLSLPSEFDHERTPSSMTLGVNVVPSFSADAFFIAFSSAVYSFVDSISESE